MEEGNKKNPLSVLKNIKSKNVTGFQSKKGGKLDSTVFLTPSTGRGFISTRNRGQLKLSDLLARPAWYIKNYPSLADAFDLTAKQKQLIKDSSKEQIKAYYDSL